MAYQIKGARALGDTDYSALVKTGMDLFNTVAKVGGGVVSQVGQQQAAAAAAAAAAKKQDDDKMMLYVGIGAVALVGLGLTAYLVLKK